MKARADWALGLLLISVGVTSEGAVAAVEARGHVEGVVVSFNHQTVKLKLDNGRSVTVKRTSIPETTALNEGARVVAYPSREEFEALAPKKGR
jgi:hypothetical protein